MNFITIVRERKVMASNNNYGPSDDDLDGFDDGHDCACKEYGDCPFCAVRCHCSDGDELPELCESCGDDAAECDCLAKLAEVERLNDLILDVCDYCGRSMAVCADDCEEFKASLLV
jgi:hypothetical protein